jgi:5-methylcytosine-specific restriction endonuclease McrA
MLVYVLNKDNKPLMPCKPGKARQLLRDGQANVVQRTPFTIQLLYGSSGYKQPVTLGVDAGSKIVGLSATTDTKVVYSAEVQLRNDIAGLLATRRQLRRSRRSRRTRYRQSRFLNRRKSKGWLAPSVRNKIDTHITMIGNVHKLLPITNIVVEVAAFDIQKIKSPDIEGVGYQQGDQLGFYNVREYVLHRDDHKCQHCKGKSGDKKLQVHHIESRSTGGNAPNNLVTLCSTCHDSYHTGTIELKIKRGTSYKDATFMGIMRWAFYDQLKELYPSVSLTYGYVTKYARDINNLPKDHRTDALCITGNPNVIRSDTWYYIRKVRCHNRQIHKCTINKGGYRKLNQSPYITRGFRLFDKVRYNSIECFIFGRRVRGSFDLRMLDGTKVYASVNFKRLELLESSKTILIERR